MWHAPGILHSQFYQIISMMGFGNLRFYVPVSVKPKFCNLVDCFYIWMDLATVKKKIQELLCSGALATQTYLVNLLSIK